MTRLLLVRHATHALVGKVLAGRMPGVPLSDEGRAQARAVADHIAQGPRIAALLSSPLERCLETAAFIAERTGVAVKTDAALQEIDCGEWTGLDFETLATDPRWQAWNHERGRAAIPGGETAANVESRIAALFETWVGQDRSPAVLVTHSDVIKIAILGLLGASLDRHDRLQIDPASITTIDLWPGGGKVVHSNQRVPA